MCGHEDHTYYAKVLNGQGEVVNENDDKWALFKLDDADQFCRAVVVKKEDQKYMSVGKVGQQNNQPRLLIGVSVRNRSDGEKKDDDGVSKLVDAIEDLQPEGRVNIDKYTSVLRSEEGDDIREAMVSNILDSSRQMGGDMSAFHAVFACVMHGRAEKDEVKSVSEWIEAPEGRAPIDWIVIYTILHLCALSLHHTLESVSRAQLFKKKDSNSCERSRLFFNTAAMGIGGYLSWVQLITSLTQAKEEVAFIANQSSYDSEERDEAFVTACVDWVLDSQDPILINIKEYLLQCGSSFTCCKEGTDGLSTEKLTRKLFRCTEVICTGRTIKQSIVMESDLFKLSA